MDRLPQDVLDWARSTPSFFDSFKSSGAYVGSDGRTYIRQMEGYSNVSDSSDANPGYLSAIRRTQDGGPKIGYADEYFDTNGNFTHTFTNNKIESLGAGLLKFAAVAGGMAFGLNSLGFTGGNGVAGSAVADAAVGAAGTSAAPTVTAAGGGTAAAGTAASGGGLGSLLTPGTLSAGLGLAARLAGGNGDTADGRPLYTPSPLGSAYQPYPGNGSPLLIAPGTQGAAPAAMTAGDSSFIFLGLGIVAVALLWKSKA